MTNTFVVQQLFKTFHSETDKALLVSAPAQLPLPLPDTPTSSHRQNTLTSHHALV